MLAALRRRCNPSLNAFPDAFTVKLPLIHPADTDLGEQVLVRKDFEGWQPASYNQPR